MGRGEQDVDPACGKARLRIQLRIRLLRFGINGTADSHVSRPLLFFSDLLQFIFASYFKLTVFDRVDFVQDHIEPIIPGIKKHFFLKRVKIIENYRKHPGYC